MKLMRLRRPDKLEETPVTLPGRGIKPPSVTVLLILFLSLCVNMQDEENHLRPKAWTRSTMGAASVRI